MSLTLRISFIVLLFGGVMLLTGCQTAPVRNIPEGTTQSQSPPPLLNDNPTVPPVDPGEGDRIPR